MTIVIVLALELISPSRHQEDHTVYLPTVVCTMSQLTVGASLKVISRMWSRWYPVCNETSPMWTLHTLRDIQGTSTTWGSWDEAIETLGVEGAG